MDSTLAFGLGVLAGIFCFWLVSRLRERDTTALAQELVRQTDAAKTKEVELLTSNMRDSVKALTSDLITGGVRQLNEAAADSLSRYTTENRSSLDSKKELIDQSLVSMNEKLEQVSALVTNLNMDRERKFGELTSQLVTASSETTRLRETTEQLRSILSNPAARGQWGERMAEDVLRAAGLVDGINYRKQVVSAESGTRPDFTFLLPNDLTVNMDVKFPLSSYLAYLDCTTDDARRSCATQFTRDVRNRIREVSEKDYINPEGGTLDYVILFVPNERVLSFLNECDASAIDDALKRRVVVCSPFTLYAVLVVIRQAMDNFNFERATSEMLDLLGAFNKQWDEFVKSFDGVESRLESLQDAFTALTTTRRKQLDRVLTKIGEVRVRQGIVTDAAGPAIDSP
ncbi:MAG: DNA recombination protein RmuC [Gemmatimonadales bacterium]|jgi:DNA recombination protein RmuC